MGHSDLDRFTRSGPDFPIFKGKTTRIRKKEGFIRTPPNRNGPRSSLSKKGGYKSQGELISIDSKAKSLVFRSFPTSRCICNVLFLEEAPEYSLRILGWLIQGEIVYAPPPSPISGQKEFSRWPKGIFQGRGVGVYILRPHAAGILSPPPPFYTPPTPRRVFSGAGGWGCIKSGPVWSCCGPRSMYFFEVSDPISLMDLS